MRDCPGTSLGAKSFSREPGVWPSASRSQRRALEMNAEVPDLGDQNRALAQLSK